MFLQRFGHQRRSFGRKVVRYIPFPSPIPIAIPLRERNRGNQESGSVCLFTFMICYAVTKEAISEGSRPAAAATAAGAAARRSIDHDPIRSLRLDRFPKNSIYFPCVVFF